MGGRACVQWTRSSACACTLPAAVRSWPRPLAAKHPHPRTGVFPVAVLAGAWRTWPGRRAGWTGTRFSPQPAITADARSLHFPVSRGHRSFISTAASAVSESNSKKGQQGTDHNIALSAQVQDETRLRYRRRSSRARARLTIRSGKVQRTGDGRPIENSELERSKDKGPCPGYTRKLEEPLYRDWSNLTSAVVLMHHHCWNDMASAASCRTPFGESAVQISGETQRAGAGQEFWADPCLGFHSVNLPSITAFRAVAAGQRPAASGAASEAVVCLGRGPHGPRQAGGRPYHSARVGSESRIGHFETPSKRSIASCSLRFHGRPTKPGVSPKLSSSRSQKKHVHPRNRRPSNV